ncbi:uncharacterized protein F5891DRAFT_126025 [Suillus fuscotomentosus]|uniref:Uncharacterized protein n=1 Tax=Suillus fuscotomentosus TaxID=1912939 RepID=A0AAD4HD36_9AGAM|nr:uncharacterized protein F5891DRAFT_126025 [Suillus fuscotomentosus]KAG1890462.1 hypothetical protein F5891DRAFT_126025 [Suillus fuscotomentosus]
MMSPVAARFRLLHTAIISSQAIILVFGYTFLGTVLYYDYLSLPDQVSNLWSHYPGELAMIASLIATVLSVTTAAAFTFSIKEALRHRILQPISLVQLSAGVALAKGSIMLRPEHLRLTTMTLFAFGVLRLLTAGWTTLLTPTYFLWPVEMRGSELDITGSAFSTLLFEEFRIQGLTAIQDNSFEILDIGGMLSGVSAAGYNYGLPGTFNFNGAKYNVSTQGIVPAIEDYSGSDGIPSANGTRLGFSGGNVTVNLGPIPGEHTSVSIPQGFSRNYSMWQQGLTANVSCRPIDPSQTQYGWNTANSSLVYANSAASNDSITGLRLWNISANCGANTSMTQEYVTMADANGNANVLRNGFLPSVVCPGPTDLNQTYTSFTIISQGFFKYRFLDASVCEVTPLLTTVRANYSSDLISSEVISSTPFQPENEQLLSFVIGTAKFQSISSQGLTSSAIGDTLYTVYSSTTNTSIDDNLGNQTQVYKELEEYWRGVVEFSATFLRSGFMVVGSFPDNTIPDNLSSPINGTMYISTIGWTRGSMISLLAILPITIITILTVACTLYSILHAEKKNIGNRINFNASNPLHLIMAAAAGGLTLQDFDDDGIIANEGMKVTLQDNGAQRMFVEDKVV